MGQPARPLRPPARPRRAERPVTIRSDSRLERLLHQGRFCVTAEVVLPRSVAGLRSEGRLLSGAAIESPPRYFVGVADVPLAKNYDFSRIEQKAERGADFVQTQIVFDVDAFGDWAERARERGLLERMFVLAG